jgi:proteasome beta subunit
MARRIYPVVAVVDAEGYRRLADDALQPTVEQIVTGRFERPGGPTAPIGS